MDDAYFFILFVVRDRGYVLAVNGPVAVLEASTRIGDRIMDSVRPPGAK